MTPRGAPRRAQLFSGGLLKFKQGGVASGFRSAAAAAKASSAKLFAIKSPAPGKPAQARHNPCSCSPVFT